MASPVRKPIMVATPNEVASVTQILYNAGDVIIMTGSKPDKQLNFLASSTVLSVASKVFAALFSDRYSEGQKLSALPFLRGRQIYGAARTTCTRPHR